VHRRLDPRCQRRRNGIRWRIRRDRRLPRGWRYPAAKYLARTLIDGSPHVAELVDELVTDTVKYIAAGVETGMIKPTGREWERAAIMTIWGLGTLVIHEHLERLIGVDVTAHLGKNPGAASAYMAPVLEIYSQGVLTETAVQLLQEACVDASVEVNQEKETA